MVFTFGLSDIAFMSNNLLISDMGHKFYWKFVIDSSVTWVDIIVAFVLRPVSVLVLCNMY